LLFRRILRDLLQSTRGSLGAIFLDSEGETVEAITERPFDADDHDLRVIGAYQGIHLSHLKRLCDALRAGTPHRFKIEFEKMNVLSCDLKDGYYLVLVVDDSANEGVAWRELEMCRDRIVAEL
jgi:predicted regulator of Ras-like GTPase activity (Roadblock/LC7/MglB family)